MSRGVGGGAGGGVKFQIIKKNRSKSVFLQNYVKFTILKNSR